MEILNIPRGNPGAADAAARARLEMIKTKPSGKNYLLNDR